jgi:hypothetical protein
MRRFILSVIYILLSLSCLAQLSEYKGPAIWLRQEAATEIFKYISTDSLKTPVGDYQWRLNYEDKKSGWFSLAHIKANFKNKLPDGEFELLYYQANIDVDDFDHSGIKSAINGSRTLVHGSYTRGKLSNVWRFEYGSLDPNEPKEILIFNVLQNNWNYQGTVGSFNGKTVGGSLNGLWIFNYQNTYKNELNYSNGILTSFRQNNRSYFEQLFASIQDHIKKDSIAPAESSDSYIWNVGFSKSDSVYIMQLPVDTLLKAAMTPYQTGKQILTRHPLLSYPEFNGSNRLYFRLNESMYNTLKENSENLIKLDSTLKVKIELPVFQLRRKTNKPIDSLLYITESLKIDVNRQKDRITKFLSEESRYVAPKYLLQERNLKFNSHTDYAYYLLTTVNLLNTQVARHLEDLLEAVERLREQGAIEEMEAEWVYLKDNIEEYVSQGNLQDLPIIIYNRFVKDDFAKRKELYAQLGTYQTRRAFLIEAITYYEFFRGFFMNQSYQKITNVEDKFLEQFTKFLYNPYMGVNNVEVLVKKKFLYQMLNKFWPYLLNKLESASDGAHFQELYQNVLNYKQALLFLADDNDHDAKRLERRGRKENNMQEFENLVNEYFSAIKNKLEERAP